MENEPRSHERMNGKGISKSRPLKRNGLDDIPGTMASLGKCEWYRAGRRNERLVIHLSMDGPE